jgi:hypothetical protein
MYTSLIERTPAPGRHELQQLTRRQTELRQPALTQFRRHGLGGERLPDDAEPPRRSEDDQQ